MIKKITSALPSPYKLFAVFMLLLIIIIFGGVGYFLVQKNYIVQNEQHKLAAIADFRVAQIVRWRNERLNHIEYIYNNPLFARLVKAFFENPDNAEKKQDIATWMKSLQAHGLFAEVYLFDAKGREVLSSKNAGKLGIHAKGLIGQALADHMPVFSDLHIASTVDFIHFDIVIPLILPETPEAVIGIVFMRLNPQSELYELIQSWPMPSLTAETLLISREGDTVLFLNDLRYRKDTALKFRIPLTDDKVVAVKAVKGATGIINGVDYRGVPVLAAARKIPDTPWIMIAKIDKKEIYAPLYEQAWIAAAGMFFLIIGLAAAIRLWWWRQRTVFYRELYEERKHSEERLRQLAAVVENSNDAIFAVALDGIITSWNRGAEASFGYKEFEVFGKSIAMLIPPVNQNEMAALLEKIKKRKNVEHYDTACRRRNGRNVNLSLAISPVVDSEGKIIGVSFIGRDITGRVRMENELRRHRGQLEELVKERTAQLSDANQALRDEIAGHKQTEEELQKSEIKFKSVFENAGSAIFLVDADTGMIMDCNPVAENLVGRTRQEITGRPVAELHPGDREKVKAHFFDTVKNDCYSEIEADVLDKSGRIIPVLISGQVVTIDNRKVAIGFFFDITERKKITEKLRDLNDAKDRFLSIIGHDLKNMFNNILGFGDLLKEDIKKGNIKTIEEEVNVINSASGKAYNMLMNLMEWASAQRGNLLFNPCPLVLNELLNEELDGLNETAVQKNIKLKITVPDNFKATADKDMLKIILRNLITNAIKFSYRNGEVELRAAADDCLVEISVSDNGVGMTEDAIQKLFKPGVGSSEYGTENEHGTGLGLLLCDEFVKKHGGKIWVESEPGKGSSFKFTLPLVSEAIETAKRTIPG